MVKELLPCPFCGQRLSIYPIGREFKAPLRVKHNDNGCVLATVEYIQPSKWNNRYLGEEKI